MKLILSVSSVFLAPLMLLAAPAWTYGEYTEASMATTAEAGNLMQVAGTLLTVENNEGAFDLWKKGGGGRFLWMGRFRTRPSPNPFIPLEIVL